MTMTWSVNDRHHSERRKQNAWEKVNPKKQKLGKVIQGLCSISGRNKSQFFTK